MNSPNAPMVRIRGLRKVAGQAVLLDGIDLDVARGEVLCVIGPSGSGKSTLLRCLHQLETFQRGVIEIDGELMGRRLSEGRLHELPEREIRRQRAQVAMVFQSFNLFPHMTAQQNVAFAPTQLGKDSQAAIAALARELLARVGLAGREDAYPAELSGGQQQRVAIARALAMQPKVMLFDEPTSALDPELVGEVLEVMRELARNGLTMIVVTHEIEFALSVAHRVAFLEGGRILEHGAAGEVLTRSAHVRTQAFLRRFNTGVGSQGTAKPSRL